MLCILATRSEFVADAQLATQYAEGWANSLTGDTPERARRERILNNVASVMCHVQ